MTELVALKIVDLARAGEWDAHRLLALVLREFEKPAIAVILSNPPGIGNHPDQPCPARMREAPCWISTVRFVRCSL